MLRLLVLLVLLTPAAPRAEWLLDSGNRRVQLVELYTSEGCSSCPPADAWLSGLRRQAVLWQALVPVAFHVDYWDHIGWPDRFASSAWSARQRQHAALDNISTVYTPGFVVDGREWRGWFSGGALPRATPPGGRLRVRLVDERLETVFAPALASDASLTVHVARLGFGLHTQVRAGENAGRLLSHDFVVLGLATAAMQRDGARHVAALQLPASKLSGTRPASGAALEQGLAVWVTPSGQQRPLQAVGGYLPRD